MIFHYSVILNPAEDTRDPVLEENKMIQVAHTMPEFGRRQ